MVCPVLEFMEEKRTFAKIEEGKVDFFHGDTEVAIAMPDSLPRWPASCCQTHKK
jgi:hypothetical protein